jgi:hypothetical protein
MSETDIDAGIPGFSHQRSFYSHNYKLSAWNSVQGWNWAIEAWPYLVLRSNTRGAVTTQTIVLKNGLSALWFDKQSDGTFVCRYGMDSTNLLEALPGQGIYRYTQISGDTAAIIDFQDFNQPASVAGMMVQRVDGNSFVTTVTGYGNKCITALETVRGDETYQLTYDYISSGLLNGKIEAVTLVVTDNSGTRPIRRCSYLYYDGTTFEGLNGDLKAAIVQQPVADSDPQQWEDIEVRYYRYTTEAVNDLQPHLLSMKVGPTMYMLLKQRGQDVLTMTQSSNGPDLAPEYANNLFTYDDFNRVVNEVARGGSADTGLQGVSYARTFNPNVTRGATVVFNETYYNTWYWKIVEEGSSTLRKTIYTNDIGQILAQVLEDTANPVLCWIDAYHLDANGSVVMHAYPSAVAGIDETLPDLIGMRTDGSFSNLKADQGRIDRTQYYANTTATATTAGGVAGYLQATYLQQGYNGAWIQQSETTYIASPNTSGPVTYVTAAETKFASTDGTSGITTTYSYLWIDDAAGQGLPRVQQRTITLPAVPVEQGGDGIAHTSLEYYDGNGNVIWSMDERGVVAQNVYDPARQLLLQQVRDVDAVDTPPGWSVLPGSHFNESTDYTYDDLGRQIHKLGPLHNALVDGVAVSLRSAVYNCYVDAPLLGQSLFGPILLNQQRQAGGYQLAADQSDNIIDPVGITMLDKCGRTVQQVSSARSSGSGALSPSDTFMRADWSRWQTFFFNERGLPAGSRGYHEIPAASSGLEGVWNDIGLRGINYDESFMGYEPTRSLVVREVGPEGTITRYTYDVLSRKINTYVGTNDTVDCHGWEAWTPDCTKSNLVLVNSLEYEEDQSSDSFLTKTIDWLTDQTARITHFVYDFRGRLLQQSGEEGSYTEFTYDNLDRLLQQKMKNRDASGNIIAFSEFLYNDLSQAYQLRRYAVNPTTGTIGNYLTGSRQYDPVGNVIESSDPGASGRTIWTTYDNLYRITTNQTGYWSGTAPSLIPVVMEGTSFNYDSASNVIFQQLQQLDTGSLDSTPSYRMSYQQAWVDAIGRVIATAQLGALSSAPAYPDVPPSSSDTVLVSLNQYNNRAELYSQVDPSGRENRTTFDDKGRIIETVENYVSPGLPVSTDTGINRTTQLAYTSDDQISSLTAVLAGTGNPLFQTTLFEYGTDLSTSGIASNKLLSAKIYADDSLEAYAYNRQAEKSCFADANGTVHEYDYDGLGRLLHDKAVELGEKITSGIRRISLGYEVRGMVAKISSASSVDTSQPYTVNEILREYDDFGDLTIEFQEHAGALLDPPNGTRHIKWTRNEGDNNTNRVTQMIYPTGRQYAFDYGIMGSASDLVDQLIEVDEVISGSGHPRVIYDYLGLNQIVKTTYPEPQISLNLWGNTVGSYQGLDLFGRIIDQRWTNSTSDLARLQYGYNLSSQRTYRRDTIAESLNKSFDELYGYDGLNQITALTRGKLNTAGDGIESGTQSFYETFKLGLS